MHKLQSPGRSTVDQISATVRHLDEHIQENGYMPASLTYDWYKPCWFRDSSMVAMSLVEAAKHLSLLRQDHLQHTKETALNAVRRQLGFLWGSFNNFIENVQIGLSLPIEDDSKFLRLDAHLPARVGNNGRLYSGHAWGQPVSDTVDNGTWLRQYDSLPLLLMATRDYISAFGIEGIETPIRTIRDNMKLIMDYMAKVYKSPSSSIWEIDPHQLHSTTLAAIYRGFASAIEISHKLDIEVPPWRMERLSRMDKFISDFFVKHNMLFKSKNVWKPDRSGFESEPVNELDASSIFVFTKFRPPSVTAEIEAKTMNAIDNTLFRGIRLPIHHYLPIRFLGDTYFYGGRWLLLGLEAAKYYMRNGNTEKAQRIISYVGSRYTANGNVMLPEQEIVDPASDCDPDNYYKRNGCSVIKDLAWSEAAHLSALVDLNNLKMRNQLLRGAR
ncbi:MAG: hypothetical protein M1528_01000 [Candidatus Marsarchaeota archaeon]|nr:hypothetical protein [Candidatus Marsarchaeota archaeon]MCL5115096.1 hypothetical protein [Candidatus Marsarchaeota archaeon]